MTKTAVGWRHVAVAVEGSGRCLQTSDAKGRLALPTAHAHADRGICPTPPHPPKGRYSRYARYVVRLSRRMEPQICSA